MGAVVALSDERVGFGFLFLFALDELDDVGMVDVEDDHLCGAASFASGLDDSGEGVETFHEAERTAGGATAPLEEHAFGLRQSQDGIQRIFYRVDETRGALRLAVAGDAELDLLSLG